MIVLSLDPGGTTGYCVAEISNDAIELGYKQAEWSELELFSYMGDLDPDHIVYESFQYRPQGMKQAGILRPCELIGVIRLFAQSIMPPGSVYSQTSSKAVGSAAYFTNDRLKQMNLYIPGLEHGQVACKHFLFWLMFGGGFKFYEEQEIRLVTNADDSDIANS